MNTLTDRKTGLGHQKASEKKNLLDAMMDLQSAGNKVLKHTKLFLLINEAILEANSLACAAEDRLNDAA